MNMKEYIQKNIQLLTMSQKVRANEMSWMSMKEYTQKKNHTAAHNVTKGPSE